MKLSPVEKEQRRGQRLDGVLTGRVPLGPEVLHLHITNRCGLSCRYCWYHAPGVPGAHGKPQDLSWSKFRQWMREAVALRVDALVLSGDGEPTLHPRFSDMMGVMEKLPLEVTLLTNGTFPARLRRQVLSADRVVINLGAADRALYRTLQGADQFEKVLANIRWLVAARKKHTRILRIELACIANQLNAGQRTRMKALAAQLGVDALEFVAMQPHTHNQDLVMDEARSAVTRASSGLPCFNGWFYASIGLDGRMSLCCHLDQVVGADLKKMTLEHAWTSVAMRKLRLAGRRGLLRQRYAECHACRDTRRNLRVAQQLAARRV